MALSKPFFQFPDEILVKVQESLRKENHEYTQDMQNLVLASREFYRIAHPDKPLWLLTKVLPVIFPYIRKEETLDLRLVCSDWRDAVDEYLGNHRNLQAFKSGTGQLELKPRSPKYTPILLKGFKDEVRFLRATEIFEFLQKSEDHRRDGKNPVLSRSLAFSPTIPAGHRWGSVELEQFWELAVELLRSCGTHIHYLLIGNDDAFHPNSAFIHDVLLRILPLCPNLRSLEVTGKTFELGNMFSRDRELATMAAILLPPLPQLEYLDTPVKLVLINGRRQPQTVASPISDVLYLTYGQQVKRLGFGPRDLDWVSKEHRQLSQLTELTLGVHGLPIGKWKEAMSVPSLCKLSLPGKLQLKELFEFLGMFPSVKVLNVGRLISSDVDGGGFGAFRVPSLLTLSIKFSPGIDFSFLSSFPSIMYLDLTWDLGWTEKSISSKVSSADQEDPFNLSEFVVAGNLSKCPVWKQLVKLREIHLTVVKVTGHISRSVYTRERFEYLQKMGKVTN